MNLCKFDLLYNIVGNFATIKHNCTLQKYLYIQI